MGSGGPAAPASSNVQLQSAGVHSITVLVFKDLDGDGVKQPLEPVAQLAQLVVTDTATDVEITSATQLNGEQTIPNLGNGTYSVRAWGVSGFFAQPVQVIVADSNATVSIPMTPLTQTTVHGIVFDDINADATRGPSESPLDDDVEVTLYSGTFALEKVTTAPDGSYAFSHPLVPSVVYHVHVAPPVGRQVSINDIEVHTDNAAAGTDIGVYEYATLSGVAYLDLNRNGQYDVGTDKPLQGATVALNGPTEIAIITLADGRYSFSTLKPGDYTLSMTVPDQLTDVTQPKTVTTTLTLESGDAEEYSLVISLLSAGQIGCSDFASQMEAQSFFNKYYPTVGDFAGLDADNDKQACEQLAAGTTTSGPTTSAVSSSTRSNSPATTTSARSTPSSSLAHTGADPKGPLALAGAMIGVGGALLRRRHRSSRLPSAHHTLNTRAAQS